MQSCKVMRQMPGKPGLAGRKPGEAGPEPAGDETGGTSHEHPDTGSAKTMAGTGGLLDAALTRQNLQTAWRRVKANNGAAGVDGLDIEATAQTLRTRWTDIRRKLLAGHYRPEPVRKVMIPKPDGSPRELGIPTVTDRLIQQALLQVLQPLIDPTFSEHSHGFRPGRRAHDAVKAARSYVQEGKRVVVDMNPFTNPSGRFVQPSLFLGGVEDRGGSAEVVLERSGHVLEGFSDPLLNPVNHGGEGVRTCRIVGFRLASGLLGHVAKELIRIPK